jgi:hypothetical protein
MFAVLQHSKLSYPEFRRSSSCLAGTGSSTPSPCRDLGVSEVNFFGLVRIKFNILLVIFQNRYKDFYYFNLFQIIISILRKEIDKEIQTFYICKKLIELSPALDPAASAAATLAATL